MPTPRTLREFALPAGRSVAVALLFFAFQASGQRLESVQKLLLTGQYDACIAACEKVSPEPSQLEDWRLLQAEALLSVGRYREAEGVISNALLKSERSLRLRERGIETARSIGNPTLARQRMREVTTLAGARAWQYRDPPNIVALGRVALQLGADPKTVLERLYQPAQKADPNLREAWLASGQLALDKHDYALAAKSLSEAQKRFPNDADVLFNLARAYQPSARSRMIELLETALAENTNHVPSMLLLVDHHIDAEEYAEADQMLDRALAVNLWHPQAWAYRAVLAHLRNDAAAEAEARNKALKYWKTNPEVDHLIGRKLSQNYRFAEGAACQRRALEMEPDYLPAQMQLAEDLLRLGEEAEGWQLAESVHRHDAYDVTAYNLAMLRGTMRKFQTLTNADFILRMSPNEAALYGDRALALLDRAKQTLVEKYGVQLERPTVIEIFPEQKDFGVRTFGMPHNPGFLGVCFGRVVTMNSPVSAGGVPSNWEAVLWHEFCHVVTLQLTRNKMPRWLSEGISVYEERQVNSAWGQRMNPRYRELVMGGDLTPVSELSSAFLSPKSEFHVQFAYYQSSLVVEFLVGKYGADKLKAILNDLGDGVEINRAIENHTAPMPEIETEFAAFAKGKAEAYGPELDWTKPESERSLLRSLGIPQSRSGTTASADSKNYWTLMEQAARLVAEQSWTEALVPLNRLIELCPDQYGRNNAYALLAAAQRGLNDTNAERAALEQWAERDAAAPEAYLRLMELNENARDWRAVALNAERFLAVNPLVRQPYRALAQAREELGETAAAIDANEKLLLLEPADPAQLHYRLARLMQLNNETASRRHVLQALEEAPRYREAHQLLRQLARADAASTNAPIPEAQ